MTGNRSLERSIQELSDALEREQEWMESAGMTYGILLRRGSHLPERLIAFSNPSGDGQALEWLLDTPTSGHQT